MEVDELVVEKRASLLKESPKLEPSLIGVGDPDIVFLSKTKLNNKEFEESQRDKVRGRESQFYRYRKTERPREQKRLQEQMDAILNKVGSYWIGQKANKEFNSVGDDINSLSTSIEGGTKWLVNKLKGKMQKPLPDLLKEYDLPIGIFPRDATNYEFNEETRKLTVFIPSICEVGYKDSSVVRFSTTVTAFLEQGKLADIEGMKTKVMIWVKVSCIVSAGSKLNFTAGMKRTRDRGAYEVLRDGVGVDKF
ncbi:hypothetical protein NC652_036969 [Populus alba x Populus x berolinensis]|nr:hypothetical protein NC652_036969 [Populus alba x Populus x berolinensis]